jgi:hypothetical protein
VALPVAISVAALVLYLSTLSKHYSEGEDSATYIIRVTRPVTTGELFHPNHLMYLVLNRLIYALARAAGYAGDAALPMKVVSAVAGALSLWILLTILRRLGVDDRLALVWAAITAVSYGYWSYSTQAETYTLPIPFYLLAVLTIIELGDGRFSAGAFARLGLYNALATLAQQMHILIYPVMIAAVVAIWYRRRPEVPAGRLVAGLAVFGAVSAAIVGTAYFAAGLGPVGERDLASIIRWSRGHGNEGVFSPVRWSNPLVSLIAIGHAVLGGHFLYGIDAFYQPFVRAFPHKLLVEERYLGLSVPPSVRLICLAASGIAAISGLAFLGSSLSARKAGQPELSQSLRVFACDAIVWPSLVVTFLFNTIMEPTTIEWWIAPIPIAAIGLASLQARRPGSRRGWPAGAVFAAALLVANGAGCILPQADLRADYWYQVNDFLIHAARPGDTVLTDGGFISDNYLRLYTGAEVVSIRGTPSDRLEQILAGPRGGRMWVSSWAFEPPEEVRRTRYFTRGHRKGVDAEANRARLEALGPRLIPRHETPAQRVWELLPPG